MIIDKEVEVGVSGMIQYYQDLGYTIPTYKGRNGKDCVKNGTKITVKIEDLKPNSTANIHVSCDCCGKETIVTYQAYNGYISKNNGKYYCKKCNRILFQDTIRRKYGKDHISQVQEIRDKVKQTCLKKYGVDNPAKSDVVKEKMRQTNLDRYGVENYKQSQESKEKMAIMMYQNNNQMCSSQQKYLGDLFGGLINYPLKQYSLDIFMEDDDIDIEYDGGGHDLSIKIGHMAKDDFYRNQIIRWKVLLENGIKTIRIISPHDKMPSDDKLIEIYDFAKSYFNSGHTWINFYIEENKYKNAENKDGVFYDFGDLYNGKILAKLIREEVAR